MMLPKADTKMLIVNNEPLIFPWFMIAQGLKPSLPKLLINKTLPNTPISEFPVRPKVYFLNRKPNTFAAIIPVRILISEINVPVMTLVYN